MFHQLREAAVAFDRRARTGLSGAEEAELRRRLDVLHANVCTRARAKPERTPSRTGTTMLTSHSLSLRSPSPILGAGHERARGDFRHHDLRHRGHPCLGGRRRPGTRAARTFRLTGPTRRLVRVAHLVAALGWLGVEVVIAVLAVTGFTSDDPGTVAASYTALNIFAVPLLLTFGLTTLGSGLVLSVGSGWASCATGGWPPS